MAQGKKIRLEYIGQLYTEDGNIQFLPSLESNYQLDSYGMGMFYVHPINALKSAPRSKAKKTQKKEEISFPDAAKASSWRQWRWAAVFIPVLAAGQFRMDAKAGNETIAETLQMLGVASIVEREEPMEDSLRYFEGVQGFPRKSVIPFNDRSSTASFVPVRSEQNEETQLPPEVEKPEPVKEAAVEAVKTASAENPLEVMRTVQEVKKPNVYFIIVGSYKEEANKDKRILELQALGYEAEVASREGHPPCLCCWFCHSGRSAKSPLAGSREAYIKALGSIVAPEGKVRFTFVGNHTGPMKAKSPNDSLTVMTELVLPNDTNNLDNLFGGQLLSWMDRCAAISAHRHCRRIVVTASVNNVSFRHPIPTGKHRHFGGESESFLFQFHGDFCRCSHRGSVRTGQADQGE